MQRALKESSFFQLYGAASRVAKAVEAFESMLRASERDQYPLEAEIKKGLRGKDLACWCRRDQRCYADTLLEIANSEWTRAGPW